MPEPTAVAWLEATWQRGHEPMAGIVAGCTTRDGGVSTGAYAQNNLALHVGDEPQAVQVNRARLVEQLGCRHIHWLEQVHGCAVVYAEGGVESPEPPQADACWTDQAGVALAIMTADCVPVLLADKRGRAIGAAHAGWQGLASGVIGAAVAAMPVAAADLTAWIGPCISAARYEVGADVWGEFERQYPSAVLAHPDTADKRLLDLAGIARAQLVECGVAGIGASGLCTYDDMRLYSHRRARAMTGRMASVIMMG